MTRHPLMALSVTLPWPWFILHGGKDIENRSWDLPRWVLDAIARDGHCRIALHASKGCSMEGVMFNWSAHVGLCAPRNPPIGTGMTLGDLMALRGRILGTVDIVGQKRWKSAFANSIWHIEGGNGLRLANPRPCTPTRVVSGRLGFWPVPADIATTLQALS